jgi:acetyl esterase/lipase
MAGITTQQPFKGIYALLAAIFEVAQFPLWMLFYIPRFNRPYTQWTFQQAIRMRIVRRFLAVLSTIQAKTPLSLEPGREKDRFVVLPPAPEALYIGPAKDDTIKPVKTGATWTPKPLQRSQTETADVVLHFHGGAYVVGDGRDGDIGFVAATFLKHANATHVFTPQYRLSSNPGGRFPAALQDAITAYHHLTRTLGVPASRITISGDSAGGNLALALLRYISEHGEKTDLPWPAAVWLWSPWVDVGAAMDKSNIANSPHFYMDYLGPEFGHWGASTFLEHLSPEDPYVCPLGHPFPSKSPIFIQTGRLEVLYDDDRDLYDQFLAVPGNKVELVVNNNAPHDIILTGPVLGFAKEAQQSAKKAGEFLRQNRFAAKL